MSVLGDADYAPTAIEANSGDVEWLSPRAVAHDRVLTWASDHGAVVPLPMFSLFSGEDAVHRMLSDRSSQLASTLDARRSWARVRAARLSRRRRAAGGDRVAESAARGDGEHRGRRVAGTALSARAEARRRTEDRDARRDAADRRRDRRRAVAARRVGRALADPAAADGDAAARGTMVLNAAFLVAPASLEAFQKTLTTLVERHGPHGLRFDFTGPWPPYHFVNETTDGG